MRKYFGTDGIRRIANSELTPELVYRVAKAGAYVLSKHTDHTPTIFIGILRKKKLLREIYLRWYY